MLGHVICTAIAVIGGRLLATKISVKMISLLGAIIFVLFGILGLYQSYIQFADTMNRNNKLP
jgi:putative Ca2+/H+ antiporter (TMEM165/GDT1 family)